MQHFAIECGPIAFNSWQKGISQIRRRFASDPAANASPAQNYSAWSGTLWEGHDGETEYNNGSISVEIEQDRCWIYMNLQLDPFHTFNEKSRGIKFPTKIEAVYAAVVEFIEYYNELITRKDEE